MELLRCPNCSLVLPEEYQIEKWATMGNKDPIPLHKFDIEHIKRLIISGHLFSIEELEAIVGFQKGLYENV